MDDQIILVDEQDKQIGAAGKLEAHQNGQLHRAFSIFIFNDHGELMLQKRAAGKYHCGGLWTNTCCSHPRDGESLMDAAHRRLPEEMGFDCDLEKLFSFIYRVEFANGLIEHEYDHVLKGVYNQAPALNPEEAEDWRWISLAELKTDIKNRPEIYTAWLKIALNKLSSS